jgi:formylglycine-generating enzyme
VGGTVKRTIVARTALVLAIAAVGLTGSCNNNLTWWLQTWAGLDMLEVQGGSLDLGDVEGFDPMQTDEYPVHRVTLSTFELSRFEVTQSLYESIMGGNPSLWPGDTCRPVEYVSWQDAIDFCIELSLYAGLEPCYSFDVGRTIVTWDITANGYRLPTEAEWEFAARGGTNSGGFLFAGSDEQGDVGWYDDNTLGTGPHAVGELASNELGFYDMTGNVAEWCWDAYSIDYNYTTSWTNPRGQVGTVAPINQGGTYIARGGAHDAPGSACRNAKRLFSFDTDRSPNLGFRVARNQ